MIVKNEEEVIGRCLESAKDLVDEIIIVDTGSTDKTKEIASKYTSKIYNFEWIDDFSAARNYSFSKATMDYIFWLDADDVLLENDRLQFKNLKAILPPNIDVVMMKYNLGIDKDGNPTASFYRERLLKRSNNFKWYDPIHEYMVLSGKIVNTDICISHKKLHGKTDRNLKMFERMIAQGKKLSDRNYFYYARELFLHGRHDDAIVYYNKFLDTEDGYLSNYIDSCIDLSKCYKVKNDSKKSLKSLFRSFEYDAPRAEVCCLIGYHYKNSQDYIKAIFWFELSTKIKKPENRWGSIIPDCYDFIPYSELSVCHYQAGNIDEAIKYTNKALEYKPNHPVILHNKKLYDQMIQNSKHPK